MQIRNNTVVTIRYTMTTMEGDILENLIEAAPVSYLHGSGKILPALEAAVNGLEAGEKKSIFMSPENGFPGLNDDYYLEVIVDEVRLATEEEISSKSLTNTLGNECGDGCCC